MFELQLRIRDLFLLYIRDEEDKKTPCEEVPLMLSLFWFIKSSQIESGFPGLTPFYPSHSTIISKLFSLTLDFSSLDDLWLQLKPKSVIPQLFELGETLREESFVLMESLCLSEYIEKIFII